jgi:4'-phosphopantetheinyl transferase
VLDRVGPRDPGGDEILGARRLAAAPARPSRDWLSGTGLISAAVTPVAATIPGQRGRPPADAHGKMVQARTPTPQPPIRLGTCEVWRVRVGSAWGQVADHWPLLDEAERRRAADFRHEADRARFVVARGTLRQLLAGRTGVAPEALVFVAGPLGKPLLAPGFGARHFNTSHSGDWVLHAIDSDGPVGVDVEAVRPELARLEDFELALAPEELADLRPLSATARAHGLARTWVRKEAYVKALGEGLRRPLAGVCVGEGADGRPRLRYDRLAPDAASRWQFDDVDVDDRHVACVVRHMAPFRPSSPPSR